VPVDRMVGDWGMWLNHLHGNTASNGLRGLKLLAGVEPRTWFPGTETWACCRAVNACMKLEVSSSPGSKAV
jgi:hypothetical protein